MHSSDSILPKAYGLPKIHKHNTPFRIIVSSINTSLYPLARFLHDILKLSLPKPKGHVNNSFELCTSLCGKRIKQSDVLVSIDVESLFTNVPIDLVLEGINKRWNFIDLNTDLPLEEFISAIKFIMQSTFFTFNGITYKQIFGSPMGSPLFPIVADIVMQDLEERVLKEMSLQMPFYYRYVDDILLAAPRESIPIILDKFNNYHERLKFTIEHEKNRAISFLDLLVEVRDNTIIIDWFHKKTFSGRTLSFYSNHPLHHKKGTIYSMVDRAILLSHP